MPDNPNHNNNNKLESKTNYLITHLEQGQKKWKKYTSSLYLIKFDHITSDLIVCKDRDRSIAGLRWTILLK